MLTKMLHLSFLDTLSRVVEETNSPRGLKFISIVPQDNTLKGFRSRVLSICAFCFANIGLGASFEDNFITMRYGGEKPTTELVYYLQFRLRVCQFCQTCVDRKLEISFLRAD